MSKDLEKKAQPLRSYPPPKPIRYLANTTISPDHTGGNVKIAEAGKTFTGGNVAADLNSGFANDDAAILSTEKAHAAPGGCENARQRSAYGDLRQRHHEAEPLL